MISIQEAQIAARNEAILANKGKLEQEGLVITAEEYNSLGSTYKLYVLALATKLTHNQLKSVLNELNVSL
ncbi:MAG: hypothetical protein KBT39_06800 [Bacteroidales bacterium]|nr:hypothetical protein [Bacteroidales bacterium]